MRRTKTGLIAAASAMLLCWGATARADKVDWSYNWTPSSTTIMSDSGSSQLVLSNEPVGKASNIPGTPTDIVATNVKTISGADPGTPDTFTAAKATLTLTITDDASKATGTLNFNGQFDGYISSTRTHISSNFASLAPQTVQLGNNIYTVSIDAFTPPASQSANLLGSIGATVLVGGAPSGGPPVTEAPEPASLVLAGLGLTFGAGYWWKRRRVLKAEQALPV
jgi:hypothetical protein